MKTTLLKSAFLALGFAAANAFAGTFTFTPTPADLGDLDHHSATTWGITWDAIPAGESITSATLKINGIWDWQVENDILYIHLLDDPRNGVTTVVDNNNDTLNGDYFNGQGLFLTSYTDPIGGSNGQFKVNYSYSFTQSQLNTLTSYITDANSLLWNPLAWSADFGFGFDPDCHYYNDGVTFEITTAPSHAPGVPDSGSPLALLGLGGLGLLALRRKIAR